MKHMKHAAKFIVLCMLVLACVSPGWGAAGTFAQLSDKLKNGGTINLDQDYTYTASTTESTTEPTSITIEKNTTIKGNGHTITGTGSSAPVFICKSDAGTIVIDGLTITGGTGTGSIMANADTNTLGGGIQAAVTEGSKTLKITVRNCTFTNNTAVDGGGIGGYTEGNSAKLVLRVENCFFKDNKAHYGGGIYNLAAWGGEISFDILNSSFDSNGTHDSWSLGAGAGMANETGGYSGNTTPSPSASANGTLKMTARNCIFQNNGDTKTAYGAGAFQSTDGGAVSALFENCLFDKNKAANASANGYGGGFISIGGGTASDALTLTLKNCTFTNNTTGDSGFGGGFCNWQNANGSLNTGVVNCTFKNNTAGYGGGLFNRRTSNTKVTNCTFVSNTAKQDTGGAEVHIREGKIALTNTILWNGTAANVAKTDAGNDSAASAFTLTNCAYPAGANFDGGTPVYSPTLAASWGSSHSSNTFKINNVSHTVYKLRATDDTLIRGGTKTAGVPATDQIGMARGISKPSIGAVEFLSPDISTATLPEGTVDTEYSTTLAAAFDPAQSGAEFKWSRASGTLPTGLTLGETDGKITGTPTAADTYTFTVRATGSGDIYKDYSVDKSFTLKINAKPEEPKPVISSPDIGTVSITVTNAVGANKTAFTVQSKDIKLVTTSNDLTAGVKVNGTAYKVASPDATPKFSVSAGNAKLLGAYMTNDDSNWKNTSDLDALNILDLTAIKGQEAFSETEPDYYRFQFSVSDDHYFILELAVLLSGEPIPAPAPEPVPETEPEPEPVVIEEETVSGSVNADTEPIMVDGETYYFVPANGDNNLVKQDAIGKWQLPQKIDFKYVGDGISGLRLRTQTNPKYTEPIKGGQFNPDLDGRYSTIGADLSATPVHAGTIFLIWLKPVGRALPFMKNFAQSGAARIAKVENGEIVGAMVVQNAVASGDIDEEITTLVIDTADLRDPDSTDVKVPVPQGKYSISYSTLFGEVSGTFSEDIELAAANYEAPTPAVVPEPEEQEEDDSTPSSTSRSGSGGCNSGFASLAGFAVLALALKFRKRRA
ncbi:MAG: putative Ig domain-containing protein [Synergistaceae bacterium]|nr:putative Ig domain-containing protein [Synergistaceae bacterium]